MCVFLLLCGDAVVPADSLLAFMYAYEHAVTLDGAKVAIILGLSTRTSYVLYTASCFRTLALLQLLLLLAI